MHEAPPAKHFKSSACWPRYILSWTFLVDLYIGHWNFNIFAPTGWLLRLFYTLDPLEICSDERENPYLDQFWCSPGSVKNIHSWHSGGNPTCLDYVSERLCQSCVGMIWLVWFGWQNPPVTYFDVDTFTTRALYDLVVKSPIKPYSALLCNAYIQSRPLVCWSESEWSPSKDLNRSLSQICRCHCEALATSWSPSSASTLWSYHCWEHTSKKAGVWALSNILHLSQNFWLRTQNPLCVFEDCIANFITDMSKYCRKFPPIYSLLGYLVEYFKWNAGQQNGANRRLKSPPLQVSVLKRKKKREIFSFFCISQSNMRWTHCLCLGKMRT